jgi:hypothetical protein
MQDAQTDPHDAELARLRREVAALTDHLAREARSCEAGHAIRRRLEAEVADARAELARALGVDAGDRTLADLASDLALQVGGARNRLAAALGEPALGRRLGDLALAVCRVAEAGSVPGDPEGRP